MSSPKPMLFTEWKARSAWLCAVALILVDFVLDFWLGLAARRSPEFAQWLKTTSGLGFTVLVQGGYWLFFAFWFSSAASSRAFLAQVGLGRRPILFGWFAAVTVIGIALIDSYGTAKGWTASSRRPHPVGYDFAGVAWWFFAAETVVIVPFYEELVMRGFLYRAFRGSYGPLLSTCFIICISANFHWGSVSSSMFTAGSLVAFSIVVCTVRERTNSLWNCLLCHSVYNAFGLHLWLASTIGMLLLLPVFRRKQDLASQLDSIPGQGV